MDVHPFHVHGFLHVLESQWDSRQQFFRAGLTGRPLAGKMYRDLYHIMRRPEDPGIMRRASHQHNPQSGTAPWGMAGFYLQ